MKVRVKKFAVNTSSWSNKPVADFLKDVLKPKNPDQVYNKLTPKQSLLITEKLGSFPSGKATFRQIYNLYKGIELKVDPNDLIHKFHEKLYELENKHDEDSGFSMRYVEYGDLSNIQLDGTTLILTFKAYGDRSTTRGNIKIMSDSEYFYATPRWKHNFRGEPDITVGMEWVANRVYRELKSQGIKINKIRYYQYLD